MTTPTPNTRHAGCIQVPAGTFEVQNWLLVHGRECGTLLNLLQGMVPLIQQQGVPLDRLLMSTYLVHPQLGCWHYKFENYPQVLYQEIPIEKETFKKLRDGSGEDSPFNQLKNGAKSVRVRHTDAHIPEDVESHFRLRGYTDMYMLPVHHRGKFVIALSFGTRRKGGYVDQDVAFFDAILPVLGSVAHFLMNELVTYNLLTTYLGKDPGSRVHRGSVDRGDSVTVRSAIWFSDIRDFTSLSQQMDRDAVIELINEVFEATEEAVKRNNGEIMKFLGDGWLAIFHEESTRKRYRRSTFIDEDMLPPINNRESLLDQYDTVEEGRELCRAAKKAAAEFQMRMAEIRNERHARGLPGAYVGVGLHYGTCSYGNVGAPSRLDFTVIGPSVNLTSRVEGLCKTVDACVLATSDFVRRADGANVLEDWESVGNHFVKGVSDEVSVFSLANTAKYRRNFVCPSPLHSTEPSRHEESELSPQPSFKLQVAPRDGDHVTILDAAEKAGALYDILVKRKSHDELGNMLRVRETSAALSASPS